MAFVSFFLRDHCAGAAITQAGLGWLIDVTRCVLTDGLIHFSKSGVKTIGRWAGTRASTTRCNAMQPEAEGASEAEEGMAYVRA